MVVKPILSNTDLRPSLRVVLSHMVVKPPKQDRFLRCRLRVVLSHMVVKLRTN